MQRPRCLTKLRNSFVFVSAVALLPSIAVAMSFTPESATPPICAVVTAVIGHVMILDANRTHTTDPVEKMQVGCGSWISVVSGSIQLQHRSGAFVSIGADSFVELPQEREQLVVYRGRVYAEPKAKGSEFQILTANARARVRAGSALVLYNEKNEESQLISIEKTATFENRFIPEKKIRVKAGEASFFAFGKVRVIPTASKTVAAASVKQMIAGMNLGTETRAVAVRTAQKRASRKIASFPVIMEERHDSDPNRIGAADPYGADPDTAKQRAAQASIEAEQARYMRNKPSALDQQLKNHWVRKLVGGSHLAEKYAAREESTKGRGLASVPASRPARVGGQVPQIVLKPASQLEEEEKQKLIDELKRIEQ